MSNEQTHSTCQICGRGIKSKNGKIALHGYKRPGQDWQTASCFGARYRPYEVACDALPVAIDATTRYRDDQAKALRDMLANPPATLSYQPMKFGYPNDDAIELVRPDNYDVNDRGSYCSHSYDGEFKSLRNERQSNVKGAAEFIRDMQKRLADWKAP